MKAITFQSSLYTMLLAIVFEVWFLPANAQVVLEPKPIHYVFPAFIKGLVKLKNGLTEEAMLNYNIVSEEMVFERNGLQMAMDKPEIIDTVIIRKRCFVPYKKVFCEIVTKGPAEFYIQHKGNLVTGGKPVAYGGTSQTAATTSISSLPGGIYKLQLPSDYYVSNADLFWIKKGSTIYKAYNERQIIKVFPEKAKEIKAFVKEQNVDFKKAEDVKKLVEYMNELI